jgi:hypothetical protein
MKLLLKVLSNDQFYRKDLFFVIFITKIAMSICICMRFFIEDKKGTFLKNK